MKNRVENLQLWLLFIREKREQKRDKTQRKRDGQRKDMDPEEQMCIEDSL